MHKDIEFKLVDFHERTGSLQVVYHNEDLPEGVAFSINIPIVNGGFLQGDELVALINSYAPKDVFERAAAIRQGGIQSPVPGLPSTSSAQVATSTPQIFADRQLFVVEDHQRVLLVRPLVQARAFPIPVEVV
ncbi:MAG: hypothetical protein RJB60_2463 [Pseudomonadota bacterium]|jgi:hypothetical protein